MNLARGNLFTDIPESLTTEQVETLVAGDTVRIERILSRGHVSGANDWYEQSTDEWVTLISGRARLDMGENTDPVELTVGDWILLPAGVRHRVDWTDPEETCIWLAVHLAQTENSSR